MVESPEKADAPWDGQMRCWYLVHHGSIPGIFLGGSNVGVKIQYGE